MEIKIERIEPTIKKFKTDSVISKAGLAENNFRTKRDSEAIPTATPALSTITYPTEYETADIGNPQSEAIRTTSP
jgi:hypothetical protein